MCEHCFLDPQFWAPTEMHILVLHCGFLKEIPGWSTFASTREGFSLWRTVRKPVLCSTLSAEDSSGYFCMKLFSTSTLCTSIYFLLVFLFFFHLLLYVIPFLFYEHFIYNLIYLMIYAHVNDCMLEFGKWHVSLKKTKEIWNFIESKIVVCLGVYEKSSSSINSITSRSVSVSYDLFFQ